MTIINWKGFDHQWTFVFSKDVRLPVSMQRSMAAEAEGEIKNKIVGIYVFLTNFFCFQLLEKLAQRLSLPKENKKRHDHWRFSSANSLFYWILFFSLLQEAADVINESPIALQLRYLQTLTHISAEKNSTIVFPIPGYFPADWIDIWSIFFSSWTAEIDEISRWTW